MDTTNNELKNKGGSKKKWLLLGLGIAVTGALSFFGLRYYKKHKEKAAGNEHLPDIAEQESEAPAHPKQGAASQPKLPAATSAPNDSFPLKNKSKGANVKALQEALIAKFGKTILPKFGADGDFGTETINALKKAGLPEIIDESTYHVLVSGSPNQAPPIATGLQLFTAVVRKDFNLTLNLLKTLRTTKDYQDTSTAFQNYRIGGVRQTLVNGALNSFTDSKQKDAIRMEFLRMGLKYDGNKWALSGVPRKRLITIEATKVWKDPKTSVPVPANMVLGELVTEREGYAVFENAGQRFLVNRAQVSFYTS